MIVRALAVFAVLATAIAAPAERTVTWPLRTMGTYANVSIVTADSAASAPAAEAARRVFVRVDSLMSNWTTTSEVARLNREAGRETVTVQPEVAVVLDRSLQLWRETGGAFDVTVEPLVRAWGFLGGPRRVPGEAEARAAAARVGAQRVHFERESRRLWFEHDSVRVDLGGIAKGYAVDEAMRALRAHGVTRALVDLTGNMAAIGTPPGRTHWTIGIRDPHDRVPYFARVTLEHGDCISTSGKYEQFIAQDGRTYGHIMDPRTGRPAEGPISVTVISHSAFTCDAWDTPLFVLGVREARLKAKERTDFAVVIVEPGADGVDTVWVESELAPRFTLEPGEARRFRVVVF
ncbi:MAG: FAD:protein FMN transferase [Candidatus Eisenbacteria bacterium]